MEVQCTERRRRTHDWNTNSTRTIPTTRSKWKQVSATTDLFDKAAQLWTNLEEDQQVQQWDKEEERISTTIQDLNQRQKTMSIMEHIKGA
jgi:hypothetical protein